MTGATIALLIFVVLVDLIIIAEVLRGEGMTKDERLVRVSHCDNCDRCWPASMIKHGECSSGEGSFCPACRYYSGPDDVDDIADGIDDALTA